MSNVRKILERISGAKINMPLRSNRNKNKITANIIEVWITFDNDPKKSAIKLLYTLLKKFY